MWCAQCLAASNCLKSLGIPSCLVTVDAEISVLTVLISRRLVDSHFDMSYVLFGLGERVQASFFWRFFFFVFRGSFWPKTPESFAIERAQVASANAQISCSLESLFIGMACIFAGRYAGVLALVRALYWHSGVTKKGVQHLALEVGTSKFQQSSSCAWRQKQFGLRGSANTAEDVGCATSKSVVAEPWLPDPATEAPTTEEHLIGMVADQENQVTVNATGALTATVPVVDDANMVRNLADLKGLIKLNVFEATNQAEWTIFKEDFINVMALVSEGTDVLLDKVAVLSDVDIE